MVIEYLNIPVTLTVVESHPDNAHPDLRLDRPFSTLVQYADALDLSKMSKQVCDKHIKDYYDKDRCEENYCSVYCSSNFLPTLFKL